MCLVNDSTHFSLSSLFLEIRLSRFASKAIFVFKLQGYCSFPSNYRHLHFKTTQKLSDLCQQTTVT